MKKLLIASILFIASIKANAQYTELHNFVDYDGIPSGSLISSGSYLYGMSYRGGVNDNGHVFKIKPDGSGYSSVYSFSGTADGSFPRGSLIQDGVYLYGMTETGGVNNYGVIFKVKPDGSAYQKLLDFNISNGAMPLGDLLSDGIYLYGLSPGGGANGFGRIFKIKNDGTGYTNLHDFGSTTADGKQPWASLISDGTFLYGTTSFGGVNDSGTVFKIKPDGTSYSTILDFSPSKGSWSHGSLVYDGTFLYGMTTNGGANNFGVLYKIKPDGTGYTKLMDFTGANGKRPWMGSLIIADSILYGMTASGGANDYGRAFKIKVDGTGDSTLYNFSPSGAHGPSGSLLLYNDFLYGMTGYGGLGAERGAIFKLKRRNYVGIEENEIDIPVSVFPNPSTGIFHIEIQPQTFNTIHLSVMNLLGECIMEVKDKGQSGIIHIDLSAYPSGIYFITVETDKGKLVKKLIKE
jgi:uncharacterized repeat protein (TIGR03803 family)